MRTTCCEPSCSRPARGRGLCGTHYAYRRRRGTLPDLPPRIETCTVDGCDKEHDARGYCRLHYQRLQSTGSLEQPLATGPDEARFWAKVDKSGGPDSCWLWTAGISGNTGYGNVWWYGTTKSAHRVAYELLRGAIDPALTIDHLCRVRHCVNPVHMELVTQAENNRRIIVTDELRTMRSESGFKGAAARWSRVQKP